MGGYILLVMYLLFWGTLLYAVQLADVYPNMHAKGKR